MILHMTDGIIAFDRDGKIVLINPAAQKMMNVLPEYTNFEDIFGKLFEMTAFSNIAAEPSFLIMYLLAFVLLYLGIVKHYEPLLLIPIAFGVLIANFPGGEMGVIQADSEGYVTLANGTRKIIWEMPLHEIAHELGLMNFIYYMLIKTGFLPPVIFMGVGAMTDFGPLIANPKSFLLGAAAQLGIFGAYFFAISCILIFPINITPV